MNENAEQCFKQAVDKLKYAVSISVQVGDYDSAERILTQLRNLETLTTTQTQNQNEVTALGLLRELMAEAYNKDTDLDRYPHGCITVTSSTFDKRWIPKVKALLGIP